MNIPATDELTEREIEVTNLVIAGLSNPQIAVQLGLGRQTVKTHVSRAMLKLGVTNRHEMWEACAARHITTGTTEGDMIDESKLTEKEIKLNGLLLSGESCAEISRLTGMSESAVRTAVIRLRKKLEESTVPSYPDPVPTVQFPTYGAQRWHPQRTKVRPAPDVVVVGADGVRRWEPWR